MKDYKHDQHFLIDISVLARIIEYSKLKFSDTVLEIGAGSGILTKELTKSSNKVIAIEIDNKFSSFFLNYQNVELVSNDALKIEFPYFNKVVSNLPYSISSPITFKLLEHDFEFGILMYQYEFAKRMVALHGNKDYGRLSIGVQYYADVEILEIVPHSAFSPPPDVSSAIVKLTPRPPLYKVKNVDFFMTFIEVIFSQRRKKIKNAILNNASLLELDDVNSALKKFPSSLIEKRPETLSPKTLAEIADILFIYRKINF